MLLDIVTLFPGICEGPLRESIVGRAQERGLVTVRTTNPRDFTRDRHRTVDDTPYGGGAGMVLKPEPLVAAVESVRGAGSHVVLLTPQGRPFTQVTARRLAGAAHLVLVCGHYEGVDERACQAVMDEELSLGDYVLTNGTIAAVVVADAVIRLLPGVLGADESSQDESFGRDGWLEYPHYTRPVEFRGMRVPEVLLSGDHGNIEQWRREQSLLRTAARRPELLQRHEETGHE
ncbi:MAG: tRNA (guanosine(37)-N1)-methyltransferase TrmD [Lentisphaerae bacterium]|nr:tRNA (guanosine(37)-N1)-methyltransferase TrmD [Lentisphaerota bacterium]